MRKPVAFLAVIGMVFLVFQSFMVNSAPAPGIPEDVKDVLISACYDCHSNNASSDKSKDALNFDEWGDYKVSKKISKLADICELVDEGKMPPAKYLKSKPDKALSDAQKKLICDWTGKESVLLLEGN